MAGRCIIRGKEVLTEELPAYCAVAVAGLGNLPDTILTRSVIVRMRRRSLNETVKPFRRRVEEAEVTRLRECLSAWSDSARESLTGAWPTLPDGIGRPGCGRLGAADCHCGCCWWPLAGSCACCRCYACY
jgi:uncharacterized protein DUF3631